MTMTVCGLLTLRILKTSEICNRKYSLESKFLERIAQTISIVKVKNDTEEWGERHWMLVQSNSSSQKTVRMSTGKFINDCTFIWHSKASVLFPDNGSSQVQLGRQMEWKYLHFRTIFMSSLRNIDCGIE